MQLTLRKLICVCDNNDAGNFKNCFYYYKNSIQCILNNALETKENIMKNILLLKKKT